jgi:hypothetical protein
MINSFQKMDEHQNQNKRNSPKNMNTVETRNTTYRPATDANDNDSKLSSSLPPADGGMHPPSFFGFPSLGTRMTSLGDISLSSIGNIDMVDTDAFISREGIKHLLGEMASYCKDNDEDGKLTAISDLLANKPEQNSNSKPTDWNQMFKNELTRPCSAASLPLPDVAPIFKAGPESSSSKTKKSSPPFFTTPSDSMEPLRLESLGSLSLSDPDWLVRDVITTGVALNADFASLQHLLHKDSSARNTTTPSNHLLQQETNSTKFRDFYAARKVSHQQECKAEADTNTPPTETTPTPTTKTKTETKSRRKAGEPDIKHYLDEDEISDCDVLCGRGGRSNHFPGNKFYLAKIAETKATYHQCELKSEKTRVAQSVVDYINHERKGRFLELEKESGRWFIVSNRTARTKAGQALRDNNSPEARAKKREKYGRKIRTRLMLG